jgi:predicted phosphoribosyltransferase
MAVGRWYRDFAQLGDEEVRDYLDRAAYEMAH